MTNKELQKEVSRLKKLVVKLDRQLKESEELLAKAKADYEDCKKDRDDLQKMATKLEAELKTSKELQQEHWNGWERSLKDYSECLMDRNNLREQQDDLKKDTHALREIITNMAIKIHGRKDD